MFFRQFYDPALAQYAYLIGCPATGKALLIDPERDIDQYLIAAEEEKLKITHVVETHIHADFLSGVRQFSVLPDVSIGLPRKGDYAWGKDQENVYLLDDEDVFLVGLVEVGVVHTPGHTPEHLSFLVTDRGGGANEPIGLVSGDFIFVGDAGRPDLLEEALGQKDAARPAAHELYASVQQFLELPDYLHVWPGHGAGSACGKSLGAVPETTVGYERRFSPALEAAQIGEERFVSFILADQPEAPAYFGRMKRMNQEGPPLLDALPRPVAVTIDELVSAAEVGGQVLDTRPDRQAFMEQHVQGSLYAPSGKRFLDFAGAFVHPDQPLYLVAEAEQIEMLTRQLIRISIDDIRGYVTPEELTKINPPASINQITFADISTDGSARVLDVRTRAEYHTGHLPKALHASHTQLILYVKKLPQDEPLLVHCGSGARASGASAFLASKGFDVIHVDDKFTHWNGETEKSPTPPV